MNNNTRFKYMKTMDMGLFTTVLVMIVFGLVMVFSASAPSANAAHGDSYYYLTRQLMFAGIGLALMLLLTNIDYHKFGKLALPILGLSLVFLLTVHIPGLGQKVNGATRWIKLGVSIQPSEAAKLGLIIYFAYSLSVVKEKVTTFYPGMVRYAVILALFSFVLWLEPHLSAIVVILATVSIMLIIAGAKMSHLAILALLGGGVIALLLKEYQWQRIMTLFDPSGAEQSTSYQIMQSLYAVGSGGLFGLGIGQSHQKFSFIPEPQNDFIFSIICEELGWVGAIIVIALFTILIWKGYRIAQEATDIFGALLAAGITTLVAIQACVNIAVVTALAPVTGMALPFFSAGGTSLVVLMSAMGILLNVSAQTTQAKAGVRNK